MKYRNNVKSRRFGTGGQSGYSTQTPITGNSTTELNQPGMTPIDGSTMKPAQGVNLQGNGDGSLAGLASNPTMQGMASSAVGAGVDLAADSLADKKNYTHTKKEAAGTIGGSILKGAATGAIAGAAGLNPVTIAAGAVIGAVTGLVTGLLKNRKKKKAAEANLDNRNEGQAANASNIRLKELMARGQSSGAPTSGPTNAAAAPAPLNGQPAQAAQPAAAAPTRPTPQFAGYARKGLKFSASDIVNIKAIAAKKKR